MVDAWSKTLRDAKEPANAPCPSDGGHRWERHESYASVNSRTRYIVRQTWSFPESKTPAHEDRGMRLTNDCMIPIDGVHDPIPKLPNRFFANMPLNSDGEGRIRLLWLYQDITPVVAVADDEPADIMTAIRGLRFAFNRHPSAR